MTPQQRFDFHVVQRNYSDILDHLPTLRSCAKGNVLEIGVREGVSTAALLMGLEERGGHLWSIDIDEASGNAYRHPQWTFLRANSVTESPRILQAVPSEIDVLFVDGDHAYGAAKNDFYVYGNLVKSGVIMAHDVDLVGAGVRQAMEEYAAAIGKPLKVNPGSYGLGILEI